MISVEGLIKKYKAGNEEVCASDNINIEFGNKGLYFILGKSGCGKTTLLNILSGLDKYDEGSVFVDGVDIGKLEHREIDEYRNIKMGIVFQDYNLISDMNVFENLRIALELQTWDEKKDGYKQFLDKSIKAVLKEVDLVGYEKRRINELSGGEKQRVAIARALLKKPDILFADEPTGNLDKRTSDIVLSMLKKISKKNLVIVVTHDKESAYKYGDKVIYMHDGSVLEQVDNGNGENVYSFDISLENEVSQTYKRLDIEKISSVLKKYFDKALDKNVIISNIVHSENDVFFDEISMTDDRTNVKSKNLPLWIKIKLSLLFSKKRLIRLFFTMLILSISTTLLYFSLYVNFYNEDDVMVEYMKKNNPAILPVFIDSEYEDDFYYKKSKSNYKGELLYKKLQNVEDEIFNTYRVRYDEYLYAGDNTFTTATLYYIDENVNINGLTGRMPSVKNEIVISDYIAHKLDVDVGDELLLNDDEFNVCGIISTDYIEVELVRKMLNGRMGEFLQNDFVYKYCACYIYDEYICAKRDKRDSLELSTSDFTNSDRAQKYETSKLVYTKVDKLKSEDLLEGRLPIKDDEVVVSRRFALNYDEDISKILNDSIFQYKNIYDEKYNGYYGDNINLYSFFSQGVKVVGVVDDDKSSVQGDVYVKKEVWDKIIETYYDNYYGEFVIYMKSDRYEQLMKELSIEDIHINEPAINNIRAFSKILEDIKYVLYILLVLIICLNFITIGTFIDISIKENRRNLGILRTLGVSLKDCGHIFSIEFLNIFAFSSIICLPILTSIIHLVNGAYISELTERTYNIIKLDNGILLCVLIVELIINIICSYIPINTFKKRKPIEIVRGN